MRVITGSAKGRRLITPNGSDVRPTVDRVKEGIFSALQFDLEGRRILDLFAGSGQLGIEAISRGAKSAVFVDSAASSIKCVKQNIANCEFEDVSSVISMDSISYINTTKDIFDIAFLDPPYKMGLIEKVIPSLEKCMSDFGIIVCEHALDEELSSEYGAFSLKKQYRYGKVMVSVYKRD